MILNEINPNTYQSVPDPYYGGENGFQDVYNMLDKACDKIIQNIE
jgi:protein-tyrosine phosphatase